VETALRGLRQKRSSEEVIQLAIRLALLACLAYWSFILVRPFIPILAWSAVLAIALYPSFKWLSSHVGNRPKFTAAIITLACLVVVIAPAAWLGLGLIDGLKAISELLETGGLAIPLPPAGIDEWPLIGPRLSEIWRQASTNLDSAFRDLAPYMKPLAGIMLSFAGDAGKGALKFLVSVILAGCLLPAGPRLVAASKNVLARIVPEHSEDFLALAVATTRSVAQGVIGVALIQSLLAGVGLKLAGVPGAGLLAFVILILGILQLGSALVIIPTIIWIWTAKDFATALTMTIYLLLVGILDNIMRPLFMSRGLATPMLVIFIGVLGGMFAHGIVGLFVGPIILAVAWELLRAWMRDEGTSPSPKGSAPANMAEKH
jgi:predicted PurR-regulated permease PerM